MTFSLIKKKWNPQVGIAKKILKADCTFHLAAKGKKEKVLR